MSKILSGYEPKEVLKYFEEISEIPRGSGNEENISNYLVKFAKDRGFKYIQDEYLNVCIYKDGTKGLENKPSVIIQGHMDMVCEKNEGTEHNFINEGIKLEVNGDWISGKGTTLGADNGVAMAMGLAILDSKTIKHPPIELLITSGEEIGLIGATNFDTSVLKSKMLINLDTGEDGVFLSSCAGGIKFDLNVDIEWIELDGEYEEFLLVVNGLKGGHSGAEIHLQRGNSNVVLSRVLHESGKNVDMYIRDVEGGAKDNAIAREGKSKIFVHKKDINKFKEQLEKSIKDIKNELRVSDSNLNIELVSKKSENKKVYSKETFEKYISSVYLIQKGVATMSLEIDGLVETSNNIGAIKSDDKIIGIRCALRSSVASRKYNVLDEVKLLSKLVGATLKTEGDYPAWEYNPESRLREVFKNSYYELFNSEVKIDAIHAGLECGILTEKMEGVDIIAFGPEMLDIHTPDEKVSITSLEKTYKLLVEGLKRL